MQSSTPSTGPASLKNTQIVGVTTPAESLAPLVEKHATDKFAAELAKNFPPLPEPPPLPPVPKPPPRPPGPPPAP